VLQEALILGDTIVQKLEGKLGKIRRELHKADFKEGGLCLPDIKKFSSSLAQINFCLIELGPT